SRTYTPAANYNGSDSFTFKVNDGQLDSNVATVSISITPVNDAPVLTNPGNKSVDEGSLLQFSLSATDVEVPGEGQSLTYSIQSGKASGMTLSPSGLFSWTPAEDQDGSFAVTFKVTDTGSPSLSDTTTITINVNEVNQAPTLAAVADQTVDEQSQ